MHYEDGELLSYLDSELPAEKTAEVAEHLRDCDRCAASVARLEAERAVAADALGRLQPAASVTPIAVAPEPTLAAGPAPAARSAAAAGPRRVAWGRYAAAAAAAAVLLSFAFAPVRGAAANLLQVFRVQKVQTVSLTQADLKSIDAALKTGQGHVDLKAFGEAWIDGAASKPETVTLAQAQSALDFPVKLPADATSAPALLLRPAESYRFKLKVDAINQALAAYGAQETLPAALDGKVFSVKVPAILLAQYGTPSPAQLQQHALARKNSAIADPGLPNTVFVGQARSPELVVPDGVDPAQLREMLLNLPFIPASVRTQLAAVNDWQSTLIIPSVDGQAHDIQLGGVSAVVISPKSPARDARAKLAPLPDNTTVIWNDNGVVRAVGGTIDEETAIKLAKSTMQ